MKTVFIKFLVSFFASLIIVVFFCLINTPPGSREWLLGMKTTMYEEIEKDLSKEKVKQSDFLMTMEKWVQDGFGWMNTGHFVILILSLAIQGAYLAIKPSKLVYDHVYIKEAAIVLAGVLWLCIIAAYIFGMICLLSLIMGIFI